MINNVCWMDHDLTTKHKEIKHTSPVSKRIGLGLWQFICSCVGGFIRSLTRFQNGLLELLPVTYSIGIFHWYFLKARGTKTAREGGWERETEWMRERETEGEGGRERERVRERERETHTHTHSHTQRERETHTHTHTHTYTHKHKHTHTHTHTHTMAMTMIINDFRPSALSHGENTSTIISSTFLFQGEREGEEREEGEWDRQTGIGRQKDRHRDRHNDNNNYLQP